MKSDLPIEVKSDLTDLTLRISFANYAKLIFIT